MKKYGLVAGAFLILLGAVSVLFLMRRDLRFLVDRRPENEMEAFLKSFRISHHPKMEINLSKLYGGNEQFEVLHPLLNVKSLSFKIAPPSCETEESVPENLSKTDQKAWACHPTEFLAKGHEKGSKDLQIEKFLNEKVVIPDDVLMNPPFVFESGYSYAYSLFKRGFPPYNQKEWVQKNLALFKTSELKEVLERTQIEDSQFLALSEFSENEIKNLIEGSEFVLTKNYFLVKNQSQLGFSPLSYWVYDIRDLRASLQETKFEIVAASIGTMCLQQVGSVCWTYNSKTALASLSRYSLIICILVGVVFTLLLSLYVRDWSRKNLEQKRHRLSLQVLSHEFRTPVSSMLLLMDQLNRSVAKLPSAEQDLITRASSEVFRLQRVIEMSKNYLQTKTPGAQFNRTEIPSINNWIGEFAAEVDSRIQCELLPTDKSFFTDVFWLRFILTNLLQNAFSHGKTPVRLRLYQSRGKLCFSVEDGGSCEFESLGEMCKPFVKSPRSHGMGLGLNISSSMSEIGGGKISFSKNPTSFTLSLLEK